jgi:hypothetical protein
MAHGVTSFNITRISLSNSLISSPIFSIILAVLTEQTMRHYISVYFRELPFSAKCCSGVSAGFFNRGDAPTFLFLSFSPKPYKPCLSRPTFKIKTGGKCSLLPEPTEDTEKVKTPETGP